MNLEPTDSQLGCLALKAQGILLSQLRSTEIMLLHTALYIGARDLKSGLHVYMAISSTFFSVFGEKVSLCSPSF